MSTVPLLVNPAQQPDQAAAPYPHGFGLALSPDGREVFSLTQKGFVSFGRGLSQQLDGRWIHVDWGGIPEGFWYYWLP